MAIDYDVRAHHSIDGPALSQINTLKSGWLSIKSAVLGVAAVLGARRIAQGMQTMLRQSILLNAEYEEMKIGTAAALYSNIDAITNFNDALVKSSGLVEKLEQASIVSPATPQQFVTTGNMIAAMVAQAKSGFDDIEAGIVEMSNLGIAAGQALNIPALQTASDIMRILAGQAGLEQRLWQMINAQIGMTSQEFNKLTAPERYEQLKKTLEPFGAASIEFAKSWTGLTSTVIGQLQIWGRAFGNPLFERIKLDLSKVADWYMTNKARADAFAESVGTKLVTAYEAARESAKWMWEHADDIKNVMVLGLAAKIGTPAVMAGAGFVQRGLASRQASMAATAAATWASFGQGPGVGGYKSSSYGAPISEVAALTQSMKPLTSSLSKASVVAVGLTPMIYMLSQAMMAAWTEGGPVVEWFISMTDQTLSSIWMIGSSFALMSAQAASDTAAIGAGFFGLFGLIMGWLKGVGIVASLAVNVLHTMGKLIGVFAADLYNLGKIIVNLVSGDLSGAKSAFNDFVQSQHKAASDIRGIWSNFEMGLKQMEAGGGGFSEMLKRRQREQEDAAKSVRKEQEKNAKGRGRNTLKVDKVVIDIKGARNEERMALLVAKTLANVSNRGLDMVPEMEG